MPQEKFRSNRRDVERTLIATMVVQFAVLLLLTVFAFCLLANFERFVDILPDQLEFQVGTLWKAKFSLNVCLVVMVSIVALICVGLGRLRARLGESLDTHPIGKLGVGIVLLVMCLLVRLVGESRGLLPTEFSLVSIIPKMSQVHVAFLVAFGIWIGATVTLARHSNRVTKLLWHASSVATLALAVWTLSIRFESHERLLMLGVAGPCYLMLQLLQPHAIRLVSGLLGKTESIPEWMSYREFCVAMSVMSLLTAHAMVGFFYSIPAWKMFRRIERWTYELTDSEGQPIDIRQHVPERSYTITSSTSVRVVGEWIAATQPDRAPLRASIQIARRTDDGERWLEDVYKVSRDEDGVVSLLPLDESVDSPRDVNSFALPQGESAESQSTEKGI